MLIACVVLAAACQRKPAGSTTTAPASQPEAAGPAAESPSAPAAEPSEASKVEITDALVVKYLEYQKEQIKIVTAYDDEATRNIESSKGDTTKALNEIAIASKMTRTSATSSRPGRRRWA